MQESPKIDSGNLLGGALFGAIGLLSLATDHIVPAFLWLALGLAMVLPELHVSTKGRNWRDMPLVIKGLQVILLTTALITFAVTVISDFAA